MAQTTEQYLRKKIATAKRGVKRAEAAQVKALAKNGQRSHKYESACVKLHFAQKALAEAQTHLNNWLE